MCRDLLKELEDLPNLFSPKKFLQIKIFKSDKVQLWVCLITYGSGEVIEGFGVSPEYSIESCLDILYNFIKDGMPNMSQREILERYNPNGLKLLEERWDAIGK